MNPLIKKYRKLPVVIEVVLYDGTEESIKAIKELNDSGVVVKNGEVIILTLEGAMTVSKGDYVAKGMKGEIYPIKPDVFKVTFDTTPVA